MSAHRHHEDEKQHNYGFCVNLLFISVRLRFGREFHTRGVSSAVNRQSGIDGGAALANSESVPVQADRRRFPPFGRSALAAVSGRTETPGRCSTGRFPSSQLDIELITK